ncbi:NrfD/PsrC family molybdoenzyme membrane anchor subunit [Brenneria uluponensis]|uniref:NrfD/PsrC family molybdoenzyme membrane anchor subunit n=1 Tax=Brenneria uluponensis TaxID=3057057 RepID=UPI0028E23290|nr:NrfD/PsrC family molybdoenzyme membrane anchor subunit [Brenneria ulupoensis]
MFSQYFHFNTLVWDWPIAIYLFVLGISSGIVLIAITAKNYLPTTGRLLFSRYAAVIAPMMVILGLSILIFHLTQPYDFWYVMIFYNHTSVMSLGVILFQIYFIALILWLIVIFHPWIYIRLQPLATRNTLFSVLWRTINRLSQLLIRHEKKLDRVLLLLAVLLGVYTGFLLSTLKSFPLLNNGLLPVLFLNSGVISGLAVLSLCCVWNSGTWQQHSHPLQLLHHVELPLVLLEILLLVAFFFGLYAGGGQKTLATTTALSGFWGGTFWIGVVGFGIMLPLLMRVMTDSLHSRQRIIAMSCIALVSVFIFRMFILYAGQIVTS